MTLGVHSEIGRLRQVIVHRPGLELARLTPQNIGSLLFDDVMWARRAKEEHDVFTEALRDKGVQVHYFGQLLAETLQRPEGRGVRARPGVHPGDPRPGAGRPGPRAARGPRRAQPGRVPGRRRAQGRPRACCRPAACAGTCCGRTTSSCRRCPTTCSRGTTRAGCTAGCRSTRWPSPPGSGRPCTSRRSTGTTRCSPGPTSSPTTATTTPATCPPASRAATCT